MTKASDSLKCTYKRSRINAAGRRIRHNQMNSNDIEVVENWRASHNKILNDWQSTLRNRSKTKNIIFAQRLKRQVTIFNKLSREGNMGLAEMHDIAGCRLIFRNVEDLNAFRENLHTARMNHKRLRDSSRPYPYDYIARPKQSGYRGVHDIYEYCAQAGRDESWNGLKVEIQYRTIYQHAWATAVEVVDSTTGSFSKFGQGSEDQQEFFKITSEIIARLYERSHSCYWNLSNYELLKKYRSNNYNHRLLNHLRNLKTISSHKIFESKNVILISYKDSTQVYTYDSLPLATAKYFEFERIYGNERDVVLVRSSSQENIRQAYKNYFADAQDFVRLIEDGLKTLSKSKPHKR